MILGSLLQTHSLSMNTNENGFSRHWILLINPPLHIGSCSNASKRAFSEQFILKISMALNGTPSVLTELTPHSSCGIPQSHLFQVHGNMQEAVCYYCKEPFTMAYLAEQIKTHIKDITGKDSAVRPILPIFE